MRRGMWMVLLGMLAVAGFAAGVYAPGGDSSPAQPNKTVRITVKASEFKFTLSKRSIPKGTTAIFTVVNKGKISHDFKIAGKKTKTLNPGQKARLRVVFKKKGKYTYVCTLPGHAKAGMKGKLGVGVKAPPPVTTTTTTTTTPPPPPPPTGPIGSAETTVQVGMFEYRFDLSRSSVPSGKVTFVITNKGEEIHNFTIGGHAGKFLTPGGTETYTVGLPPGRFSYVCDVIFHIDRGMIGTLTVTS
jgi:uncharacterized cupredoxin-like copper-binding protein